MASFFSYIKQHKVPSRKALQSLLVPPLSWYGALLYLLIIAIIALSYILVAHINKAFMVTVPLRGGTFTEGILGAPTTINSVLASTEPDLALSQLVYSGLMRISPDGTLVPDLASKYSVSPDGLTYTITLYDHLKWSDRKPLTSNDVVFTMRTIASQGTTSDLRARATSLRVEAPDPTTVVFTLPGPQADFLSFLTTGILPEHIWGSVAPDALKGAPHAMDPVGSGPYRVRKVSFFNGIPTVVTLVPNPQYIHERPFIHTYRMVFFANQIDLARALEQGAIDMTFGITPENASTVRTNDVSFRTIESPSRVALFHHSGESILANPAIASLLNRTIDKNAILDTVEGGYGVLPSTLAYTLDTSPEAIRTEFQQLGYTYRDGFLERNGAPLGFAIAVENDPVALATAQAVAHELGSIGILVTVKAFDPGTFQDKLRAGDFQVFLADDGDTSIPSVYEPILPLYKKVYLCITNIDISMPSSLSSTLERYRYLPLWSVRHDRIWNFLYKIINK